MTNIPPKISRRKIWLGALLALLLAGLAEEAQAQGDYRRQDPFGDYEQVEFVSAQIGGLLFSGDFDTLYDTGAGAALHIGFRVASPFSVVTTLGAVLVTGKAPGVADKLTYDLSFRGHLRLLPKRFTIAPYLEAGVGIIGLEGATFGLLGGGGVDFRIWDDGSLGLAVVAERLVAEDSWVLPVMVAFTQQF